MGHPGDAMPPRKALRTAHTRGGNRAFSRLVVRPDQTATLTCDDGNSNTVFTKQIDYTDFPLDEITLYFANNVIYLPNEH
jgi:hypothetical protein